LNHQEIRFHILRVLYQKHYGGQLNQLQTTDKVIEEAGLGDVDKNVVTGDIVYLKDKHLVNGTKTPLGYAYPPWMTITSSGIDFVDNVINTFLRDAEKMHTSDEVKSHIKKLAEEGNMLKKNKKHRK
jgi:hypothetical protein